MTAIPSWQIPGKKIQEAISVLRSEDCRDARGRFQHRPTAREIMTKTLRANYAPRPLLTPAEVSALLSPDPIPCAARSGRIGKIACAAVMVVSIIAALAIESHPFGILAASPISALWGVVTGRIV